MLAPPQPRILIVDDSRVNRRILEVKLEERGYLPISAETGQEALHLLERARQGGSAPFDLILLDIMMPDLDGMEVLRETRKFSPPLELPIIMVTAKGQSADVVDALRAQANDFVTKPVDFDILQVRMDTHLALKRTHSALIAAQTALIQAGKLESIGYLAAGVAHEIRNPLAQIQLGMEALQSIAVQQDERQVRSLLESMSGALHLANGIVSSLLTYAESNRLHLQEEDLNDFVSGVLDLLQVDIATAGITLQLHLATSGAPALVAPGEFRQVLLNILLNAIQAMPQGGTLTLRTGERKARDIQREEGLRSGSRLRNGETAAFLEILDTGPGIRPGDLSRIYDPFFTSKPTGHGTAHGTGLGLTVAKRLVELQGGAIQISNRDQGSTGVCVCLLLQKKSLPGVF